MLPVSSVNQIQATGGSGSGLLEDVSTRSLKTAALGQNAGKLSTGLANAFMGYESGRANKAGSYDTFVGYQAGAENTSASYCTFIGALAGRQNRRGAASVFVGYSAGEYNADGVECVGIGAYAMRENVSGNRCVAIGYRAAERTLNGDFNTMVGAESGQDNRSGNYNTVIGYRSGRALFNGDENVFTGAFAGYSNAFGSGNAFVGFQAGYANQGDLNTLIGSRTGTFIQGNTNVVVGSESALNLHGNASVIVGTRMALNLIHGSSNVFMGSGADSYFTSNTNSICIGTRNAKTMSYGIVVGEDIEMRRQGTVSLGFNIQSDADNSVMIGNDLNINSVINFNNALQFNLRNIVAEDGAGKFGICNIEYTNWLQLPDSDPFSVAQSGAITVNTVSSISQKRSGELSPDSYDLRQVMPSYALFNGIGIRVTAQNDITDPQSNIVQEMNVMTKLSISNVNLTSLGNCNVSVRNALVTRSHPAIANLSSPTVVNILRYNQQTADVPIEIAKSVARPKLTHAAAVAGTPVSTKVHSLGSRSTLDALHASNLYMSFTSESGVFSLTCNVFDPATVSVAAMVTEQPKYGVVEPLVFHPSNVSQVHYTAYPQFALQTSSDSFSVSTSLNIVNSSNEPFSLLTDSNLAVSIDRTSNLLYTAPIYSFSNIGTILTRTHVQKIPSNIPADATIDTMYIPNKSYIIRGATAYSSNDVALMYQERIIDYPDSAKLTLLGSIQSSVNTLITNLDTSRSNLLYPIASNVRSNIYALNSIVTNNAARQGFSQVLGKYQLVETPSLTQDFSSILGVGFSNNWMSFDTQLNSWLNSYDSSKTTYSPSFAAWSNTALFSRSLFTEKRWNVERDLRANYSNLVSTQVNKSSASNTIINSINGSGNIGWYATFNIPDTLSNYNTWYRKYYEVPRLFMTYDDILQKRIQIETMSSDAIQDVIIFDLRNAGGVGSELVNIPFIHAPFSSQWVTPIQSNISLSFATSVSTRGGVPSIALPTIALPSLTTSNVYIREYPAYGALSNVVTANSIRAANMNQLSLSWFHPRKTSDHFTLVATNSLNQAKAFDVAVGMTPAPYFLPMRSPYFLPKQFVSITNTWNPSYTVASLSNTTHITSNVTSINYAGITSGVSSVIITDPLTTYDATKGVVVTTSNIFISYEVVKTESLVGQNYLIYNTAHCNVTQRFRDSVLQSKVISTYDSRTSNAIQDATTTTVKKIETAFVDIRQSFIYTSNIIFTSNIDATYNYFAYESSNVNSGTREPRLLYSTFSKTFPQTSNTSFTTYTGTSPIVTTTAFSNLSMTSNVSYYDTYYNLTPYIFYDSLATVTWSATNPVTASLVKEGVGLVSTALYSDLEAEKLFIKVPPTTQTLTLNAQQQTLQVIQRINNNKPTIDAFKSVSLWNSNIASVDSIIPASEIANVGFGTTTNATSITLHVCASSNGVFLNEFGEVASVFDVRDATARSKIRYRSTDSSSSADLVRYHYIGVINNVTYISSNIVSTLEYKRSHSPYGKTVNVGIDRNASYADRAYQPTTLSPIEFAVRAPGVPTNSLWIHITSLDGVRLKDLDTGDLSDIGGNYVLYQKIIDRKIAVEMSSLERSCNAVIEYTAYPTNPGQTVPTNNALFTGRFSVYGVRYDDYPVISSSSGEVSEIRIDQWLHPSATSNLRSGPIWPFVNQFWKNGYALDPNDLKCVVTDFPERGFLALRDRTTQVVRPASALSLSNLLNNEVLYIPYEASAAGLSNDVIKMRIAHSNDWSSTEYEVRLKNYAAFYSPKVWDPTKQLPYQRMWDIREHVNLSAGLLTDNYTLADSVFALPLQTTSPLSASAVPISIYKAGQTGQPVQDLRTGTLYLESAPQSRAPRVLSNVVSATIDQSDRLSFSNLLLGGSAPQTLLQYNGLASRSLFCLLTGAPGHGIVMNTATRKAVAQFSEVELSADAIHYQHIGDTESASDTLVLHIGSHEYDVLPTPIAVNISIRPLPKVTLNVKDYLYELTSNAVLSNIQDLRPSLAFTDGYLHVLSNQHAVLKERSSSNVQNLFSKTALDDNLIGATLLPSLLTTLGDTFAFEPVWLDLVPNMHPSYHINPLIAEPLYRPIFVRRWENYFNRYEHSNIDISPHAQTSNQKIEYEFNKGSPNFANILDRTITVALQVRPQQGLTYANGSTSFIQTEHLRNYRFDVVFIIDDQYSLTIEFYHTRLVVRIQTDTLNVVEDVTIPSNLRLSYGEWNNLQIVDYDINNGGGLSVYIQYDSTQFQDLNAARNVLRGRNIPAVDMNRIVRVQIRTNFYDPENFVRATKESRSVGSELPVDFDLTNYSQTIQIQNFVFAASTYSRIFDPFEDYDPITHNIAIGKQIQVKGNNNICLGNQFSTSGTNSIIVGNNIGLTPGMATLMGSNVNTSAVSDIYESIIIGNNSFKNAFIRDMIAIGSDQFNDLFDDNNDTTVADRLNKYLSKRPIVIGNSISKSNIEYEINLGNVFLKTSESGEKIMLGNNGEMVGVGFTSNLELDPEYILHVNGNMKASGTLSYTTRHIGALNHHTSSMSSTYSAAGSANLGAILSWPNGVTEATKTARIVATLHLVASDSMYAYRMFEGLLRCTQTSPAPYLFATLDTKNYVSSLSAFSSVSHQVTRQNGQSVRVLFEWSAVAPGYEATLQMDVYAPTDIGALTFTSYRT